jgi:hypothetical protein
MKLVFLVVGAFLTSVIGAQAQSELSPSKNAAIEKPGLPRMEGQGPQLSHTQLLSSFRESRQHSPSAACKLGVQNPCVAMKNKRRLSAPIDLSEHDTTPALLLLPPSPGGGSDLDTDQSLYLTYGPQHNNLAIVNLNGIATAVDVGSQASASNGTLGSNNHLSLIQTRGHLQSSPADANGQPTIAGYSPGFGPPGTVLTIDGAGFGLIQGSSSVSVLSAVTNTFFGWIPTGWSDTQIIVPVPSSMPLGKVYLFVTVNGQQTTGTYPFTVGIPPTITGYSPLLGGPGTVVTINGTGFGSTQGSGYVLVQSAVTNTFFSWTPTSWSDTQIIVPVPNSMPLGKVYLYVVADRLQTIGTYPFTVGIPPTIECYSPLFGPSGTILTINGTGFGPTQGSSYVTVLSAVTNAWTTWTPTNWTDTQIIVPVPSSMPLGKVYLSVVVNGLQTIGTYPFTVGIPPTIGNYSPLFGNPGTVLTINGTGFGPSQADSYISVLSAVTNTWTTWTPTNWSDTQITVPVPSTMPLGKVYLSVAVGGLQSIGTYPFTVGVPPSITSYSPSSGPGGTILTINGTGFGASQSSSYVTLQSVSNIWTTLTPTSWSDTQLVVVVPKLTPAGWNYLSVVVDGLQSIGTYPFCLK